MIPIFNDEAIYLQWALLFSKKYSYWSLPIIIDGKEPGYIILLGIIFKFLPSVDYLLIGRLLSIIFGGLTLLIINKIISAEHHDKRLLILLLLLTCPVFIFFSQLALAESLTGLLLIIIYYLFSKDLKRESQIDAVLVGVVIGIGWYIKTTILLVLIPILLILLFEIIRNKKQRSAIIKKLIIIAVTFFIVITPLLFNSDYQQSANIITRKSLSIGELLSFPIKIWTNNLIVNIQYLIGYLTPPYFILLLLGSFYLIKQKKIKLLIWFYGPLLAIIFIAKLTSVRYIYPILILSPLIAVEAFSLIKINHRQMVEYFIIGFATLISLYLLFNPIGFYKNYLKFFPATRDDFSQYVTNWTSGYGVKETTGWLEDKSQKQPILVFIRGDFGNPESAMYTYLSDNPNIKLLPVNLLSQIKTKYPMYFVSRGPQYVGLEKRLVKEIIFKKPSGKEFIGIYRIK